MPWRLITRLNGRVQKQTFDDGAAALDALEEQARAFANTLRRDTVKVARRTYEPVVQVQARVEVRGPRGAAGGVDVRGDGSVEAYTGRFARRLVDGDYAALREALGVSVSAEP